jgi:hypothetical protein
MTLAIIFTVLLTIGFIYLQIAVTRGRNRALAQRTAADQRQARENGIAARARIVDIRRAAVEYGNFTILKLLLEVFPADRQPAFSSAVVWELEPAALGALRQGQAIPVTVDRGNLRRIFPEIEGARYSHRYQHAYLGIENDFRPAPESAAAVALAPPAPKRNTIYRRRSRIKLFGLPLWEVAFNLIRKEGRIRYVRNAQARAVIAVGDHATGLVAVGSFAKGFVAIGQFSLGVFSYGCLSAGVFSSGILALGVAAVGLLSGGAVAVGGIAGGYVSVGLLAVARYAFGKIDQSPEMLALYEQLKDATGLSDAAFDYGSGYAFLGFLAASFLFLPLSFAAKFWATRVMEPNDNRLESPAA